MSSFLSEGSAHSLFTSESMNALSAPRKQLGGEGFLSSSGDVLSPEASGFPHRENARDHIAKGVT
jgi:hypothetical protein